VRRPRRARTKREKRGIWVEAKSVFPVFRGMATPLAGTKGKKKGRELKEGGAGLWEGKRMIC